MSVCVANEGIANQARLKMKEISVNRTQAVITLAIQGLLDGKFKIGTVLHADLDITSEYTTKDVMFMELSGEFGAEFRPSQILEFDCKLRLRKHTKQGSNWSLDEFQSISHWQFSNGREIEFKRFDQSTFNLMLSIVGISN